MKENKPDSLELSTGSSLTTTKESLIFNPIKSLSISVIFQQRRKISKFQEKQPKEADQTQLKTKKRKKNINSKTQKPKS